MLNSLHEVVVLAKDDVVSEQVFWKDDLTQQKLKGFHDWVLQTVVNLPVSPRQVLDAEGIPLYGTVGKQVSSTLQPCRLS